MVNNSYTPTAKAFYSTSELAKLLGVSRVTIFNRIKKGDIKALKVGRNFVIAKESVASLFGGELSSSNKAELNRAVRKTVAEYGETLRLLGNE